MDERRTGGEHPGEGSRVAAATRIDRRQERHERGIGVVVSEQVHRDPVRDAQRASEERPFAVLEEEEAAGDEGTGGKTVARECGVEPGAGELECEPDAGATARHVVVEVAVEALEARVDVGGEGDEQQVHVDGLELETRREAPEPRSAPSAARASASASIRRTCSAPSAGSGSAGPASSRSTSSSDT